MKPTLSKEQQERLCANTFNKLAFVGRSGENYLVNVVFPAIAQEISLALAAREKEIQKVIEEQWECQDEEICACHETLSRVVAFLRSPKEDKPKE